MTRVCPRIAATVILTVAVPLTTAAQEASGPADPPRLVPLWDVSQPQPHDATLEFELDRVPRVGDGRLAVVVGRSDLSALLRLRGAAVELPLRGQPIPSGSLQVVAYLVPVEGPWRELGRFPLLRRTRGGLDSAGVHPALDLQSDGQLAAGLPPDASPGERTGAYQDVTGHGGLDAGLRRGSLAFSAHALVLGTSRSSSRLRVADLGSSAPAVDLASYALRLGGGRFALDAGDVTVGRDPYLIAQFPSRGVALEGRLAPGVHARVAGVAGSQIVGWSHITGLDRPTHRILSAAVGLEAVPSRPGLLHLDLSSVDGSLDPLPAFGQQAVTDREESRGLGARIAAADPSGRVRLALGFARSRFVNPPDPTLSGDSALVPVRPETRDARSGELGLDVLRGARLGPVATSLSISARHERVDPEYRSVAAAVQADRAQSSISATGSLDALQFQASFDRGRDNLDDIPSLLTTRSRNASVSASLSVTDLLRRGPGAWWWPTLTLSRLSGSQVGDGTPDNGGFRFDFQVPDQRTSDLSLAAAWQRVAWDLALRHEHALVDNRQPEREQSDFVTDVYGLTFGLHPTPVVSVSVDLSRSSQEDVERSVTARNDRVSVQGDLRPVPSLGLNAAWSLATTRDPGSTLRGANSEVRLEASWGFDLYGRHRDGSQTRLFLRYARDASALRMGSDLTPTLRRWTLSGGLSLRFP